MSRAVVLDNEAVQALRDVSHRKHQEVLAHLVAVTGRRRKGVEVSTVVPTSVRVEAGWDRTLATSAAINRLRVADHLLDASTADTAASLVSDLAGVSVADAHIGAAVRSLPHEEVVVLTSDPGDIRRVAGPREVRTVLV